MQINTADFVFSKVSKKLPEILEINKSFAYIFGLWKADRCSTAKGIVGLRNTSENLLNLFENFIRSLDLEVKKRQVKGYGITNEVYCCSMPLRRIFEYVSDKKFEIFQNVSTDVKLAYFAGLIDGDGSIQRKGSDIRIFYNITELKDAKTDSELLEILGVKTTMKIKNNHIVTHLLKSRNFAKSIKPFLGLKFLNVS